MDDNNPDQYYTVSRKEAVAEIKVKGSRFISTINQVSNSQEADKLYQEIKKKYHDATHNCFAYRISGSDYRFSDDGEPSGTAGLPIFQVLQHQNLFEILVVITRYFGGTKLGTGGLVRAYSEAAKNGLQNCKKITKTKYITISLSTNYERYNALLRLINQYNGNFVESDYKENIELKIQIPQSKFSSFQQEFEQKFYDIQTPKKH